MTNTPMNIDKRIKDELGQYLLNPLISYEYSSEAVKVFVKQLFQELLEEVIGENLLLPVERTLNQSERRQAIKNDLRNEQRKKAKELLEKL